MDQRMYEFDREDAFRFARHINARTFEHGKELFFETCPYCNGKGNGNARSFSINLENGVHKCFRSSCGVKGNMVTLAKDFDFSLGSMYDTYYKPKKRFEKMANKHKVVETRTPAVKFLENRGISKQTAEKYEITTYEGKDNIIAFPFRDQDGDMWFMKYRKADFDKTKDANKEWCEKDRKPILFGMYQCNLENKTLILTEGQLDSLSVAEAGIENAVSVPTGAKGMTWIPHCWDWMHNFEEIIVFGDYEKGHITLLDDISKSFRRWKVRHVREEDYKDCKDANDILRRYGKVQIEECIKNAVALPIQNVIDLADVEEIDVFALEKLSTGIKQLDQLLYGGLPFGGISLITGKAGKGKSCFASQLLAQAIRQGYICFAYSGELPNGLFRAWLDFQIAGQQRIRTEQNRWGDIKYVISKENKARIGNWYRGKCYLYDNRAIEDDEQESLIKITEKAITRYGVRVILIDNLMTALDLDSGAAYDKYDKQSQFVKKLTRIALDYNVLVLLVAHKRKNNFASNENDEVAGSSDITNLGMITMAYDSDDKIDPDQRALKVAKNRLFGKVETKGFILDYDPKSKRIYGRGDDLNFDYGWDEEFTEADEAIPFVTDD